MLAQCLLETCRRFGSKPAVRDAFRELTYKQLVVFSRVIRRVILQNSQCPRVGVCLPASTAGMGTLFGAWWAGRTVVPLNFLLQPRELAAIVADSGIDLILSTTHFQNLLEPLPVRTLYLESLGLKRRFVWEKLRFTPDPPPTGENDLAAIVYTSGSTGEPKGVALSHGNFITNVRAAIEHFSLGPDEHMLGVLPPFHVFGLTGTTLLPILLGATVTYIPRFSPQQVHKTITSAGDVSIFMAIPSMYGAIARLKDVEPAHFKNLRLAVSGGEPLPRRIYDLVLTQTGMDLLEGYGMTETSPIISVNVPDSNRIGTVGKPLPGVEIQVRSEVGTPIDPAQEGELCVRGPLVMQGYYQRPEQTAEVKDAQGWLRTGDIVRIEDGYIRITGRAKDMMIVGGENVFPREVEAALERHPAVEEAVVLGRDDASRGEVVIAFVIPKEGMNCTAEELRAFCRDYLAGYKIPRDVYLTQDVPRGPTGKVLKRELKTRIEAGG